MVANLLIEGETQFADPEHICEDCLPIKGDDIIGTKAVDPLNTRGNTPVIVHRRACIHAQRALNRSLMVSKTFSEPRRNGESPFNAEGKRKYGGSSNKKRFVRTTSSKEAIPVKLKWADLKDDEGVTYMAEIVVVANDRKMLLADCSEIVSEKAFIVKTGSATTNEHATLEFLVKVTDLDHLQHLIDSLSGVPSVMSVERKVSRNAVSVYSVWIFVMLIMLLTPTSTFYRFCAPFSLGPIFCAERENLVYTSWNFVPN